MKKSIAVVVPLAAFFAVQAVFGISGPSINGHPSTILPPFSAGSNLAALYAGLFAMVVLVVIDTFLRVTSLKNGAMPISLAIAAITFVTLFTNTKLLSFLVNAEIIGVFMLLLLGGIILLIRKRSNMSRVAYLLVAFVIMSYMFMANNISFAEQVNSIFGFDVLGLLSVLFVVAIIVIFVMLIRRGRRRRGRSNQYAVGYNSAPPMGR